MNIKKTFEQWVRHSGAMACAALIAGMGLTLSACGTDSKTSGNTATDTTTTTTFSGTPAAGSLLAIHTAGQLSNNDFSRKHCLGCHSRADLIKTTELLGDSNHSLPTPTDGSITTVDYNPHSAHPVSGDCTTCHSVGGTNTLSCNACHVWRLPAGWGQPGTTTTTTSGGSSTDGSSLYTTYCAGCHGSKASTTVNTKTLTAFKAAIASTSYGMNTTTLKALTDTQLSAIATYLNQ